METAMTSTTITTARTVEGELPAQTFPADASTMGSPTGYEPTVGDLVAVYSRNAVRVARVSKVGPKRVEVKYTTAGAIETAQRIASYAHEPAVHAAMREELGYAKVYVARADAIDAGTLAPEHRDSGCVLVFLRDDEDREQRISEWRAEYPTQLRRWAAEIHERWSPEGLEARLVEARAKDAVPYEERVVGATHVTTKQVQRTAVYPLGVALVGEVS